MSGDLLGNLLRQVSRSFYLSLAVLPGSLREPIGLRSLPCTRRAEHHDVQRRVRALARGHGYMPLRPRIRVFFMKPS